MASVMTSGTTLRHLRDLFSGGTAVGLTDGQLLARYAASNDGQAFAALVARHGPMVAATCRAILRHEHDVEDAFQATFLVLARKAGSVRGGDALGGWLHRVAYRAAVEASVEAKRRRRREAEASTMAIADAARPGLDPEVVVIVHEEVDRLPEGLRLPVVLCDLEGLTYEQAAGRLDWTEPTSASPAGEGAAAAARPLDSSRRDRGGAGRRHRRFRGDRGGPGGVGRCGGRGGDGRGRLDGGGRLDPDHPQKHAHGQAEDRRSGRTGGGRDRVGRGLRDRSGAVR